MKWYPISMCFNLSWKTRFTDICTQLWLSQWITVGSRIWPNYPAKSVRSQTTSLAAELATIYSASAVLRATEFCFLLHQEITAEPRLKQHLEVLFLSAVHLAQSESVNPCDFKSHSESYRRPYPTVPRKYLSTCFAAIQWIYLGSHMNWLRAFTAKQIFGLVFVRFIKDPINWRYMVGSIKFESEAESLNFFKFASIGVAMDLQSNIPNLFSIFMEYFPWPRKTFFCLYHTSNPKK